MCVCVYLKDARVVKAIQLLQSLLKKFPIRPAVPYTMFTIHTEVRTYRC